MVSVIVIAGPPGPVAVIPDTNGQPDLVPSCTGAIGPADPGIRLHQLATLFDPDRATEVSICDESFETSMEQIGERVRGSRVLAWCLDFGGATPADVDPAPGLQHDCQADTDLLGALPACVPGGLGTCYAVDGAPGCPSGAVLQVKLGADAASVGQLVSVRCATISPR